MSDREKVRKALELAIDLAEAQQAEIAKADNGYKPHLHAAAAQDVADTHAGMEAFDRLAAVTETRDGKLLAAATFLFLGMPGGYCAPIHGASTELTRADSKPETGFAGLGPSY
jgi:hypothetical protein